MSGRSRADLITLVLLLSATTLSTLGDGSIAVLVAPLFESQGLSRSVIGVVVGAYSVAALIFRLTGSSLFEGTKARLLIPIGSVTQAATFVLLPIPSNPTLLAALMAINGVGFALVSTGGLVAIMAARAGDNSGSLMGWYTGFISVGYSLAGFVGGAVADRLGLESGVQGLAVIPIITAFVMAAALLRIPAQTLTPPPRTTTATDRRLERYFRLSPLVWMAFFVSVHINLFAGVLWTFFPLYGLSIGLSLTSIGSLQGVHSGAASFVRFLTPAMFRVVTPRKTQPPLVILGGLAVAALAILTEYRWLVACWVIIGLTRGVLRVSSSAIMMDASSGQDRGTASGVYLAGLDVGRIVGPLIGGVAVQQIGFQGTFLVTGLLTPFIFLIMNRRLSAREARRSDQE